MRLYPKFLNQLLLLGLSLLLLFSCQARQSQPDQGTILYHIADPATDKIRFYYLNEKGQPFRTIRNLKKHLEAKGQALTFAMNGGMYMKDATPLGLFIQNGKEVRPLNTRSGKSNFYMEPNGVFYLTASNRAGVSQTTELGSPDTLKFATQSGPMLVINGKLHPKFQKGSSNLNIRNGVGILPDGRVLFAMSKQQINFYDFATFFQKQGCRNALYLDGYVSRTYHPAQNWQQLDGDFGVIIGITE